MRDFLLELGFEELPARFVDGALDALAQAIKKGLKKERLDHGEVLLFSTPRRLAVLIRDLQPGQDDLVMEVKGPPKNIAYDEQGRLTRAGQGFLRSQGATAEAIFIKQFQGSDYVYLKKEVLGKTTATIIKPLLEDTIVNLHFPKNMRWGDYDLRLARPLRWIVCLFGEEVIPLDLGAVKAGKTTFGHRQLSPEAITVTKPHEYLSILKNGYVLADRQERKESISKQIEHLAQQHGAVVTEDEALMLEVLNLVEYPTAFCGEFSQAYLSLPAEVLETSMKIHQRYFPLEDNKGMLLPRFIGIRNGADNHLDTVIAGNEKVLEARLADARFFYDEDRTIPLDTNLSKLANVVFQEGLGSMGDKVRRMQALSARLVAKLDYDERSTSVLRAAELAKTDLVTQMVGEFPELQGVMGEKYALLQKEPPNVAAGIREHYLPRFAGDDLPQTLEGTIVSLADKLDTLVGYFALGKIPTGSQDPFALRRQAQGVVQVLLNAKYPLSLRFLIELAASGYEDLGVELSGEAAIELQAFFLARLRVILLEQGYTYDQVDAILASGDDRPYELSLKVKAFSDFIGTSRFEDLLTGFERIANLAGRGEQESLEKGAFHEADQEFYQRLKSIGSQCQSALSEGNYRDYLLALADLRGPIDRYFTAVMIMDSDLRVRNNRLSLLQKALELYVIYGDFNQIVANR